MTIGNFIIFGFLIYLIVVVSQSVIVNYNSNQDIVREQNKLNVLRNQIAALQNEINYDQTAEFKEMEAREKLGYKAPGETVVALPVDTVLDKTPDRSLPETKIKVPNYTLWWQYFFVKK